VICCPPLAQYHNTEVEGSYEGPRIHFGILAIYSDWTHSCTGDGTTEPQFFAFASVWPGKREVSVKLNKAEVSLLKVPSKLSRLVVLSESISTLAGCRYTITRIGVDGKWIGATCVGGYLVAELPPGAHHLCANHQREAIPRLPHCVQSLCAGENLLLPSGNHRR